MIRMIICILTRILLILNDLILFYKNFMTFIYQENNLLGHKINYLFISDLRYIYLHKKLMNECY